MVLKTEKHTDAGKQVEDETTKTGSVKLQVYLSYFKSLGYLFSVMFISSIALDKSLQLAGYIWLAKWSDANVEKRSKNDISFYLWIYAAICISQICIALFTDLAYFFRCARASKLLHKNLLNNVMRSPMRFFDTNPTGGVASSTDFSTSNHCGTQ